MRRLTVEMKDEDMERLESAAHARKIDPANMTKEQLVTLLVGKYPKWHKGPSLRRMRVAIKTAIRNMHLSHEAETAQNSDEAERARRLAALMPTQGAWKNDPSKPHDGVAYQKEVRAEWR